MAVPKNQKRRRIERIDSAGNVTAVYRNETEAAKKNYLSKASVSNRCHNKTKKPFKSMDFSFRFEDSP